jgi:hypothetical protein
MGNFRTVVSSQECPGNKELSQGARYYVENDSLLGTDKIIEFRESGKKFSLFSVFLVYLF